MSGPQVVVSGRNSDITNWSTSNGPDTNDPTFGNYVSANCSTDEEFGVIENPQNSLHYLESGARRESVDHRCRPDRRRQNQSQLDDLADNGKERRRRSDWLYIITASAKT